MMATKGGKRKVLSLQDKIDVIEKSNKGLSSREIASQFQCGKTQINNIISNKEKILSEWEKGTNCQQRYMKRRKTEYTDLNQLMWEWFSLARSHNVPITGRLLQEKALMLAVEMGHDEFTASNGWLHSFQKRHNIKQAVLSGEAADVQQTTVDEWCQRLPTIYQGYALKDVFNADETCLFYRTLPERSLVAKGDGCHGGKKAKDRITVLLVCSATGEKLKPVVIGRAENPRCFRGQTKSCLPVHYYHNRKAWMTGDIWKNWLNRLNNKMVIQKRKILLFIDNCAALLEVELSNIKLAYLPPNTTAKLQPLDGGIIQQTKCLYRKRFLRHIIAEVTETTEASALAKSVNVLDAIFWLKLAWDTVTQHTITKCFISCGFKELQPVEEEPTTSTDTTDFDQLLHGIPMDEYVSSDLNVANSLSSSTQWEEDLSQLRGEDPEAEEPGEEQQEFVFKCF